MSHGINLDDPIIILTSDRHYLVPMLTLFHNLTVTSRRNYKVEIWLSFDISKYLTNRLISLIKSINDNFKVSFHKQTYIDAPYYDYLTIGAWARLEAFSQRRQSNSLLLYLDSDVYLQFEWEEIFNKLPESYSSLAAVRTTGHTEFEKKFPSKDYSEYYFNSGVLIVNPTWWLGKGFDSKWKEVLSQYNELQFKVLDQDVINYLVRGDYFRLENEFNCYPLSVNSKTKIVHFAGLKKPWGFFNLLKNNNNSNVLKEIVKLYQLNMLKTFKLIFLKKPIFALYIFTKFYFRFTIMNMKNSLLFSSIYSQIRRYCAKIGKVNK
jgi:lipopolysaccharide biosynthesis glycosyltransferase